MVDFYEIDFLQVHAAKSGDAIAVRYELQNETFIHVVDGGYSSTGERLTKHMNQYYKNPSFIDNVVVTHPDKDHAEGIQVILENFQVGAIWMLLP